MNDDAAKLGRPITEADQAPNARKVGDDGTVTYGRLTGDSLKIRWKARRGTVEGYPSWIEFSPADLIVELNGVPLTTCQGVEVNFKRNEGFPLAKISFTLEELDIDAETMTILQAYVEQKEQA